MIPNNYKTSLLVPSQLPEYVRDDPSYANFVAFLQAYYEWMEQEGNVIDATKNLLNYDDIDHTTEQFLQYFVNDFLPYFPDDALLSKEKAVKIARQLYHSKGTPASYQFLFKILYNSDFDLFYTKDQVLRASAGSWYVAKNLNIDSLDPNWKKTNGYKIFGETSKSFATIINTVNTGTKTEIYLSDINRVFQSGEYIRVVDSNNQDVLFNNQPLRAKVVGQVTSITIDPLNKGSLYQIGDPAIVYGGLNSTAGIGATAQVSDTTKGSILSIQVTNGGYGYSISPNTTVAIQNGGGATATVVSVDPNAKKSANVTVPNDLIQPYANTALNSSNLNFQTLFVTTANSTLANALHFSTYELNPISSLSITGGGTNVLQQPTIVASSLYKTGPTIYSRIDSLGVLSPIQILNGGIGYEANDTIVFTGGSGFGAFANISTVDSNGSITSINYVSDPNSVELTYPLGGLGYRSDDLPTITISSANTNAYGSSLSLPGILGTGATFTSTLDSVGVIKSIKVISPGQDYIATPNVSLKVQDIVVSNVSILNLPTKSYIAYQGSSSQEAIYYSIVDSITELQTNINPTESLWNLRVYNYNKQPDSNLPIKFDEQEDIYTQISENEEQNYPILTMANTAFNVNYNSNGVRNYGDGKAKATATFLSGLISSGGQFIDLRGQPSGSDVLQSEIYNNFTYEISVEKEIAKYRDVLLNLLHPTGMKAIGRYRLGETTNFNFNVTDGEFIGHSLSYYTGNTESSAYMTADFVNKSNNIVLLNNLNGANIAEFITSNSTIEVVSLNGPQIKSKVVNVDHANNKLIIEQNPWLTFSNVATITANSGSNTINIVSFTGYYNIINDNNYSDPNNPLQDIVFAGDKILIANNDIQTVLEVNYANNIIILKNNLTNNAASLMSVNRTINSNNVKIYNIISPEYGNIIIS